jgi:uncharacterized membrane protein (UPF0127 family)
MSQSTQKKLIIFVCLLAFLGLTAGVTALTQNAPLESAADDSGFPKDKITIQTASGKTYDFDVELALTQEHQQQGMMWRKSLAEDAGMLFIFEGSGEKTFWMKNTLIPLDIIHIDEEGLIGHIHHNAKPHDLTHLTAPVSTKAVLEINGGQSERLGIGLGDKILHPVFRNILAEP